MSWRVKVTDVGDHADAGTLFEGEVLADMADGAVEAAVESAGLEAFDTGRFTVEIERG